MIAGALLIGTFFSPDANAGASVQAPKPMVLVMLGPPGSGKGTQATMLKEKLGLPHISTGDLLRDNVKRGTTLGGQAKTFMESGKLVPDQLILDMLFERVAQSDCQKGYILDGFPRTLAQAEALQSRLKEKAQIKVINLELADKIIIERLTKRIVCETCGIPYHLVSAPPQKSGVCDKCQGKLVQRSDDTVEVISRRLKVYHEQTSPLIAYYQKMKLLQSVPCEQSKEQIFAKIQDIL